MTAEPSKTGNRTSPPRKALESKTGCVSIQVLQKFFVTISMRSLLTTLLVVWLCSASALSAQPVTFQVVQDSSAGTISVLRGGSRDIVLVQNAQERIRPFLHPIMSPDGKGMLTEYRPSHHPHQTGVYWGLKATNGRDFFMTCCVPGEQRYHRRVSASVL